MSFTFDTYQKKIFVPKGTESINGYDILVDYQNLLIKESEWRGAEEMMRIVGGIKKVGNEVTAVTLILANGVRIVVDKDNGKNIDLKTEILSEDAAFNFWEFSGVGDGVGIYPSYGNVTTFSNISSESITTSDLSGVLSTDPRIKNISSDLNKIINLLYMKK